MKLFNSDRKSTDYQFDRLKEIAIIGGERLTKPVLIKHTGFALWQLALATSVAGLAAVTVLDLLIPKSRDEELQEYLEITFPFDGFLGAIPFGLLGPTEFQLGMRFGEAYTPDFGNNTLIMNELVLLPLVDKFNLDQRREVRFKSKQDVFDYVTRDKFKDNVP